VIGAKACSILGLGLGVVDGQHYKDFAKNKNY
jgi:hypothetical protein